MQILLADFQRETELLVQGLSLLKAYAADFEYGRQVPVGDLRMSTYALQALFSQSHVFLEETILFPAILQATGKSKIPTIREEGLGHLVDQEIKKHDRGRKLLLHFRLCIDELEERLDCQNSVAILTHELIDFLESHLSTQKEILLPLAKDLLAGPAESKILNEARSQSGVRSSDLFHGPHLIFSQLQQSKILREAGKKSTSVPGKD